MITRFLIISACIVSAAGNAAAINIEDWALTTSAGASPGGSDGDFSGTPENPYDEAQAAQWDISTASTVRSYSWSAKEGTFLADTAHSAAGHDGLLQTITTGIVWFSSPHDLLLTIDAEYDYMLAPGDREARMEIVVARNDPTVLLSFFSDIAAPIFGDPPDGVFAFQESVLLPAGHTYRFSYIMRLLSFSGSPDESSLANGHANFHLTVVPAPSSGLLLLAGALLLHRRRR